MFQFSQCKIHLQRCLQIHKHVKSEIQVRMKSTYNDLHQKLQTLSKEFAMLKSGKELPRNSPLLNLSPFYDEEFDVIRVGGRLSQSNLDEDKKFPYLISKESKLKMLLTRHYHETTFHGGGLLTLNTMREQFWIVNGKKLVNNFVKNCVKCFRFQSKKRPQLMADLPNERITPSRPFSNCGIDFAGPINVKDTKTSKVYIAIFVCLTTKAIHLELVTSLTKEDCIMALKRFTARRGAPRKIITDNGTNFIGARNELMKIQSIFDKKSPDGKQLLHHLASQGTDWTTIPPRAPHFGGIWEAAVKSMKRHLKRVVGIQVLKYEELLTVLQQIEAILNSRPLFPRSDDPNDTQALTPAHVPHWGLPTFDSKGGNNQP